MNTCPLPPPTQNICALRSAFPPSRKYELQDLEENEQNSAGTESHGQIVEVQWPETEESTRERPYEREAQHRYNGKEDQQKRPIGPEESFDQRRTEGPVYKYQADNSHHERKERQRSYLCLRHPPPCCDDKNHGNEHKCEGSLQKTPGDKRTCE